MCPIRPERRGISVDRYGFAVSRKERRTDAWESSARKASCGVVALSGQSRFTRLTCPSTVARPPHRAMPALLVAAPFCLVSAWVVAADGASRGPSEVIFLLEIIALLVCGRLMGE